MAQVNLSIGGRRYELACREGEEAHFQDLAALIDAKATEVGGAMRGVNETRQLLLAALLLADDLIEARAGKAPPPAPDLAAPLGHLAERIENLAARLENKAHSA